jgi:hypothetical protein
MNLKELVDLITIRQYVVNSTGNSTLNRATVNVMSGMLLLIDKKIINLLESNEFKEYINYQDVQKAKREASQANNIKSGLTRNPNTGALEKMSR